MIQYRRSDGAELSCGERLGGACFCGETFSGWRGLNGEGRWVCEGEG